MNEKQLFSLLWIIFIWLDAWIIQIVLNWIFGNVLFIDTRITYWQGLLTAFILTKPYKSIAILSD